MRSLALVAFALTCTQVQAAGIESRDCLVLPSKSVDLGGTIPGQLSGVFADIGDRVTEGQIVASLRTEVQEAVLAVAQLRATNRAPVEAAIARLEYEAQELERSETLRDRGVTTLASAQERQTAHKIRLRELEEAEMDLELSKLDLERAQAELEIRKIRSPIDGIVADRMLDAGEYLRDDGNVVTIVDLDPLRVEVFLPQTHYAKIAGGDPVMVVPDLSDGSARMAVVEAIDAVIDPASATFRVRLDLPNPDGDVIAGVRCTASFGE